MIDEQAALNAETIGYGAAARRGDVLPLVMRLTAARQDAEWRERLVLTRQVGPACPQAVIDRACAFMPEAPEPRLLRAARSIAIANALTCSSARAAWLAFARHDLLDAARLDPMDPSRNAKGDGSNHPSPLGVLGARQGCCRI